MLSRVDHTAVLELKGGPLPLRHRSRSTLGAELIKLRFLAGLPKVEAADLPGISERTATRTRGNARATP